MDGESTLDKIGKLCTQLQIIAKKNPITRASILVALQETLGESKNIAKEKELLSNPPNSLPNSNYIPKPMKRVDSVERNKRPPSRLAPIDRPIEIENDLFKSSPAFSRTNSFKPNDEANVFRETLIGYSFKTKNRKPDAGGNVILPPSCLKQIELLGIPYPVIIEAKYRVVSDDGHSSAKSTHCSVLEFTSEDNSCYLPSWIMKQLDANEGSLINFRSVTNIPKGTFVKLQPHSSKFLQISNPKAVLEHALRSFSVLTTGDTISLTYNDQEYLLNIIEVMPANSQNAISILDSDLNADFAPALDAPTKELQSNSSITEKSLIKSESVSSDDGNRSFRPFSGKGYVLGNSNVADRKKENSKEVYSDDEEEKKSFTPFKGKGYTLK